MQNSDTIGHIVSVLRNTILRLEHSGFDQNDPAFIHLKRQLLLGIAELETRKTRKLGTGLEKPIFVLRIRKPSQPDPKPELELCSLGN